MADLPVPVEETRRRGAVVSWALLVVVGLAVGALAWYPIVFAWLLGRVVAGELGWAAVDPSLVDDGIGVVVWVTAVAWFALLAVAVPLAWAVRRVSSLPPEVWWPVSLLLWVAPFAVDVLRSQLR